MGQVLMWKAEEKNVFSRDLGRRVRDKELVLDSNYRKIADEALKNNIRIKSVVIREPVNEVGVQSFYNCTALRDLTLGKIENIRKEAFSGCVRLKEVRLPRELNHLGRAAFSGCKRLENLCFSSKMQCSVIADESFLGCETIKECYIPDTVRIIGSRAFYKCISLSHIDFPSGIESIEKEAFYQTGLTELCLPAGLKKIGDSAFLKCNQLEYARIPESVKCIEKWAFHGCNRLKVLEIAHDPEFIGEWIINRSAAVRCVKGSKVDDYCKDMGFTVDYL